MMRCCAVEFRQYTQARSARQSDRHLRRALNRRTGVARHDGHRTVSRPAAPDRFVWLRGFPDMEARRKASRRSTTVRSGPRTRTPRTTRCWSGTTSSCSSPRGRKRRSSGFGRREGRSLVGGGGDLRLPRPIDAELVSRFEREVAPILKANEIRIEGIFVTEPPPTRSRDCPFAKASTCSCGSERWRAGALPDGSTRSTSRLSRTGRRPFSTSSRPRARSSAMGRERGACLEARLRFPVRILEGPQPLSRGPPAEVGGVDRVRVRAQPLLHGLGNMDRYNFIRNGTDIEGITLRLFDPATGEWSIHWADSAPRNPPAAHDRQVRRRRRGILRRRDGRRKNRPVPLPLDPGRLSRWEQAFGRRRRVMGDELDHDVHASLIGPCP